LTKFLLSLFIILDPWFRMCCMGSEPAIVLFYFIIGSNYLDVVLNLWPHFPDFCINKIDLQYKSSDSEPEADNLHFCSKNSRSLFGNSLCICMLYLGQVSINILKAIFFSTHWLTRHILNPLVDKAQIYPTIHSTKLWSNL